MKCQCGAEYTVIEQDGGLIIRCEGDCYENIRIIEAQPTRREVQNERRIQNREESLERLGLN